MAFIGELGLDGRLRPVPGVLPAAAAAARAGYAAVMVPADNRAEALLAEGIGVVAPDSLRAATEMLTSAPPVAVASSSAPGPGVVNGEPGREVPEVVGLPAARRAAEICAAGGHSVLLRGRACRRQPRWPSRFRRSRRRWRPQMLPRSLPSTRSQAAWTLEVP